MAKRFYAGKSLEKRFYEIAGRLYRSVTTILQVMNKPALIWWAASQERDYLLTRSFDFVEQMIKRGDTWKNQKQWEERLTEFIQADIGKRRAYQVTSRKQADIGTEAHAWVEWFLRKQIGEAVGAEPDLSEPATRAVVGFDDWRKSVKLRPVKVEQMVHSEVYGYAGTFDIYAEIDGLMSVMDLKTSKGVYPEMFLQISAYRQAAKECGFPSATGHIIRLPKTAKDPDTEVVEVTDHVKHLGTFLKLIPVAEWVDDMEGKR